MDAGARVYVDVEPEYLLITGEEADLLLVDLTGFKNEAEFRKEHVRVQVNSNGELKVTGERPLVGGAPNRWCRFERVFRLPENCVGTDITAKFDKGLLSVMMPKLAEDQPPPLPAMVAKPEPVEAVTRKPEDMESTKPAKRDEPNKDKKGKKVATSVASGDKEMTTASVGKEPEVEPAVDTRKTVKPPPPDGEGTSYPTTPPPPPSLPPPTMDAAEKPTHVVKLRRQHRQLVVNVVVAILVLVGLGLYLSYRGRKSPEGQPGSAITEF
uniref:17. class I heat shock protein 3 n=1 Tax=Anthurium amnicola TaxID=1678845 RepID=A0A1D1ZFQ7_9ARAE